MEEEIQTTTNVDDMRIEGSVENETISEEVDE